MKKICVIGLGYIGLPTAAVFAMSGYQVIGVDINEEAVKSINGGVPHIEEPGLGRLIKMMVESKKLIAQTKPEEADAFIIAVPTPNNPDKSCNLDYVINATESIIPYLQKGNVVIIESTIGPRTTEDVILPILRQTRFNVGEDIYLAHCPERVLPGKILEELVENNRIVGGVNPASTEKAAELYRAFVKGEIIMTEAKTAEMSKLMENTFRDVNIALANELVKICSELEIDAIDVIRMANKHPRVNIHYPGPGVGGHCLAVDPYFIVEKAPDTAKIISLAREVNCSMPEFVVSKVSGFVKKGERVAVLGITYKGNIDDMRESPASEIIEMLVHQGYEVTVFDPHVKNPDIHGVGISTNVNAVLGNASCALILADHNEFKALAWGELKNLMRNPVIFDTKNYLNVQEDQMEYYHMGNIWEKTEKRYVSTKSVG